MKDYTDAVRVVDLKDLLYRCLKRWRRIVTWALIVALLAALYQVYSGVHVMMDKDKYAEVKEKYAIAVDAYEATGERLRTSIVNLREAMVKQEDYNSKSELMKIDPMNKWVGSFQVYINSKFQIDPNLTYQNPDNTYRLVSAYANYLQSGELHGELLAHIDTIDELRFLPEIYKASSDTSTATIMVQAIGKNEADVKTILDFVKEKFAEYYETIRNAVGDHDYEIMTESVYSTIDLDLDAQQKANLLAITNYSSQLGEAGESLSKWQSSAPPEQEFGTWYTIKQGIKHLILGGIVGVILAFCWYAACYVISGTVKTADDWSAFGVPVLGKIVRDEKETWFRWLDRLIDRMFGCQREKTEGQDCVLLANNLSAILQEQGLRDAVFVGCIARAAADEILAQMKQAVPGTEFSFSGDILSDPDVAGNLGSVEKVILLAENRATRLKDIRQTLILLKAWGKHALGAVVID